jgi:hypothetical protein
MTRSSLLRRGVLAGAALLVTGALVAGGAGALASAAGSPDRGKHAGSVIARLSRAAGAATTTHAAAPSSTKGGRGGSSSGHGSPGKAHAPPSSSGGVTQLPVTVATSPPARTNTAPTSTPAAGEQSAHISTAPLSVQILPSPPPRSSVLGPVPVIAPGLGGVVPQLGASLPWNWFALVTLLDLGLVLGLVRRRRQARSATHHGE